MARRGGRPTTGILFQWGGLLCGLFLSSCGSRSGLVSLVDDSGTSVATGGSLSTGGNETAGGAATGAGGGAIGGSIGGAIGGSVGATPSSGGFPSAGGSSSGAAQGGGPLINLEDEGPSVDISPEYAVCETCAAAAWCDRGSDPPRCVCPPGWEGDGTECSWPLEQSAFRSVAVAAHYHCGLRFDRTVECFGDAPAGDWTGEFVQLDGAISQICGVRIDGSLNCVTDDTYRNGAGLDSVRAGVFRQVACGYAHNCALSVDGSAMCWFDADRQTAEPGPFVSISAGSYLCDVYGCSPGPDYSCGLTKEGLARCWPDHDSAFPPPKSEESLAVLEAGGGYLCGLRQDGTMVCWPGAPDGLPTGSFVRLTNGGSVLCGLRADGSAECGGLEHGNDLVPPAGPFQDISCTNFCEGSRCPNPCCGVTERGEIVCW